MPRFRLLNLSGRFAMVLVCVCYTLFSGPVAAEETRTIQIRRTPDNVRFGLIGEVDNSKPPSPTLFVFAHGIEEMQRAPVYTQVAEILAKRGWISVVVEPPCHGEDVRPGEPVQLDGWRHRLGRA